MTHPGADLEAAWDEVHDALPPGWYAGRAHLHDGRRPPVWEQYAYDTRERPVAGKRSREWTAEAPTELECVLEMARCLREIAAGRWPT